MKYVIVTIILLHTLLIKLNAQKVYVNTATALYEMNGGAGSCANTMAFAPCPGHNFYSIALFKDTLYYNSNTGNGSLFRIKTDGSGCQLLTTGFLGNCLTVSPTGIVYTINTSRNLLSYNPYTNVTTNHGMNPFFSSGDLIFYNDKLLLAGNNNGIYEINIANPGASTLYMNTGVSFFGLMAFPVACGNTKYYGLQPSGNSTILVELDLANKVVIGNVCTLALGVFDAASSVEVGTINNSLNFSAISFNNPCIPATTTNVQVTANSNTPGLLYSIDMGPTNTTGVFTNVGLGMHSIRVATPNGLCIKDSTFTVTQVPLPDFSLSIKPDTCATGAGVITVTPSNANASYTYALDNGAATTINTFNNLLPGTYTVKVFNETCRKDTVVTITNVIANMNYDITTVTDTCMRNVGSIIINTPSNSNSTFAFNNGNVTTQNVFSGLATGNYPIAIFQNGCRKDTIVQVGNHTPNFNLTFVMKPDTCLSGMGSIIINAPPNSNTTYSFNNGNTGAQNVFNSLISGSYPVSIFQNGCRKDTIIQVLNVINNFNVNYVVNADTCNKNKGSILIFSNVNALSFSINNGTPGSNSFFTNISSGNYTISIIKGNCRYDTLINVPNITPQSITKTVQKSDPNCSAPNSGGLLVNVIGNETPYTMQLNNQPMPFNSNSLSAGNYTIKIFNKHGCIVDSFLQTLQLLVLPICNQVYIPTAFSPNGDGVNDFYKPIIGSVSSDISFNIYNRFGQVVYTSSTHNVNWNGSYKNKLQPVGTYIYHLKLKDAGGVQKEYKGTLQLIY